MGGFNCKTVFVYTCQREEMANVYVDIIDKLRFRKVETLEKILEHDYQRNQVLAKLEEANRTEPNLMN